MNSIVKAIGHIISCKDASRLLSQAQDHRLSSFASWKLRMHLKVCAKCRRFESQLLFLRKALEGWKL
jgi:hypothetical protein